MAKASVVTPKEAAKLVASGQAILVDIRELAERETCRIEGDIYIPMRELLQRIGDLPTSKRIILYCHTGGRSLFAARFLAQKGVAASSLEGGIDQWAEELEPGMPRY